MGLFKGTQEQYHGFNSFTATANQTDFTLDYPVLPLNTGAFNVYLTGTVNGVTKTSRTLITSYNVSITSYTASTGVLVLNTQMPVGTIVEVILINPDLGNYQHISLDDLVNNFMVAYTGDDKLINRARRSDVVFHAKRAIQEFSYDTFKSSKTQEVEISSSLSMDLPPDYINYVSVSFADSQGVYRRLQPTKITGNPTAPSQDSTYEYIFNDDGTYLTGDSTTMSRRNSEAPVAQTNDNGYSTNDYDLHDGARFGMDTSLAQINGTFFIDEIKGKIRFSSNMNTRIVVLKNISDGLGTDSEMIVHKFAEEAVYKCIAHAVLATKANVQEYIVARFKKEKRAAIRTAKLRLSNLKTEEMAQVMRGKSKQIKH